MLALPSRSALVSELQRIISLRIKQAGLRRCDLPPVLGFPPSNNVSKCLRRFDAVCAGRLPDEDMVERVIRSALGGSDVVAIIAALRRLDDANRQEQLLATELRQRQMFVPHVHALHEHSTPEHPFFMISMLGLGHFKRVDLPQDIQKLNDMVDRMLRIWDFLDHICESSDYQRVTSGPFGRATHLLYRDTYDHAYVFAVAQRMFIGEQEGAPSPASLTFSLKGIIQQ